MITFLLSWFLPWVLLARARRLGAVTMQSVEGVGWMTIIRPPDTQRRGLNSWTATRGSAAASLRGALRVAEEHATVDGEGSPFAPKLGGEEFDSE